MSDTFEGRIDKVEIRLESMDAAVRRIGDESRAHGVWIKQAEASMHDMSVTAAVRWSQADGFRETLCAILEETKKQQEAYVSMMLRLEKLDQDWRKSMVATIGTVFVAVVGAVITLLVKT